MAKILVAEDEALVRLLICEDLADLGHEVVQARSGDEAAELIGQHTGFDLVFTDIRMPGKIDGWALGRLAAASLPGIRVIYATGYSSENRAIGPHERILYKPFLRNQVESAIAGLGF
jgi:CheY-like chemotaxis protein